MARLKLHEAMIAVLTHCTNRTASTAYVANEIIGRNLYKQKNGGNVFPDQMFLRARNYPDVFEVIDKYTVNLKQSKKTN